VVEQVKKIFSSHRDDSSTPQCVAALRRFKDFDQLAGFYTGWNVNVDQTSEGAFDGTVQLARTRSLYIVEGEFSQSIAVRGSSNPMETAFYLIEPASANSVWWGRRFEPGCIVSVGPGTPAEYSSARHTRTTGVAASTEVLKWAADSMLGMEGTTVRREWACVPSSPDALATLARRLRRLMAMGVSDPAMLDSSEGRYLEQECLRAMVFATQSEQQLFRNDLSLSSRAALVRRAEELMRSQLRQPLGAIDLCHQLGVSDRTLRQAFRERYQVGPMVYYKQLRLNAVRARLKSSGSGTIGRVARKYGFHHLGNFAADFHRAFGCTPSTLVGRDSR